jgi:hypothetical protein
MKEDDANPFGSSRRLSFSAPEREAEGYSPSAIPMGLRMA